MTHETNGIVPIPCYYIQAVGSGLCLEPTTDASGAPLRLYTRPDYPITDLTIQAWSFIEYSEGTGVYRIFNALTGFSIDVKGEKPKNDAVIQQYEWRTGQENQLWTYDSQNKWLKSNMSSTNVMVVEVEDPKSPHTSRVVLNQVGNNLTNQQWNLVPVTLVSK